MQQDLTDTDKVMKLTEESGRTQAVWGQNPHP